MLGRNGGIPSKQTVTLMITLICVAVLRTSAVGYLKEVSIFPELGHPCIDLGDYNNDGNQELAVTGFLSRYSTNGNLTNLYSGTSFDRDLTPLETSPGVFDRLPGVLGSLAWGDFDNDGDLDLAIAGNSSSIGEFKPITNLYRNNGKGKFREVTQANLGPVTDCALDWGDFDNDGLLDLAVEGRSTSGPVTRVYRNKDGLGAFEIANVGSLPMVSNGALDWADYNGDGYLDLAVAGRDSGGSCITKLFLNNGLGQLNEDLNNVLQGVWECDLQWCDYDNDGDMDLTLAGDSNPTPGPASPNLPVTLIYENDGKGKLTLIQKPLDGTKELPGVVFSALAWGDYDNDGNPDLALAGAQQLPNPPICKIYRNQADSQGKHTLHAVDAPVGTGATATELPGMWGGSIAWGDLDGDGTLDLALSGYTLGYQRKTRVYLNAPGKANKVPATPIMLKSVMESGGLKLRWLPAQDKETPEEALSYNVRVGTKPGGCDLCSGMAGGKTGRRIPSRGNALATRNANGEYEWTMKAGNWPTSIYWSVQAVDTSYTASRWARFTDIEVPLTGVSQCALAWGDYNRDGYLDLAIAGYDGTQPVSQLYTNKDGHSFERYDSPISGQPIAALYRCALAWADYDNDGYLDLMISGWSGTEAVAKLYHNLAGAGFEEITAPLPSAPIKELPGAYDCSIAWADPNNDGYLDIMFSGRSSSGTAGGMYTNRHDGTFNSIGGVSLVACSIAWGDFNNDGWIDLASAGRAGSLVAMIRENKGGGLYSTSMSLDGMDNCAIAWGDYNGDGYLDLAMAGQKGSTPASVVYRNEPDVITGGRILTPALSLQPAGYCSLAWGDYDNDGDLDLVLGGISTPLNMCTLYDNSPTGLSAGQVFPGLQGCSLAWGDYDNDGDLDLAAAGYQAGVGQVARIYQNDGWVFNTPPAMPSGPSGYSAESGADSLKLTWPAGTDGQTPQSCLTYNLRVRKADDPLGREVVCSMSNTDGRRLVPAMGNRGPKTAAQSSTCTLSIVSTGTEYRWSVQAVDAGFAGSPWSPEQTVIH